MSSDPPPRLVVVGDGGVGKTSLLRAAGLRNPGTAGHGTDSLLECACVEAPRADQLSGVKAHADVQELAGGAWVGGVDHCALMRAALAPALSSSAL
eukprot:733437-Prymnesium_polylepis.1